MSVLLNSTPQLMSSLAPLLSGTAGLCQALAAMMSIDQTPDEAMHWQQLWCVSSGALSQYVYDYQINPAYDPERYFSKAGQLFSNWGLFEALGYYTGWEIKEFNHISQQDYWALLSFELSEGRPVLTIGLDGSLDPVLVVGCEEAMASRTAYVIRAGAEAASPEAVPMWAMANAQGDSEAFSNWLVVARPGERSPWSGSSTKQRLRALRWVTQHARRIKEFFHETRENYAPGLHGFARASALIAQAPTVPGGPEFWLEHIKLISMGRMAAASCLPLWADELEGVEDVNIIEIAAAKAALLEAAHAYGRVGQQLGALLEDDLSFEQLAHGYSQAAVAEREAIEALERLLGAVELGL